MPRLYPPAHTFGRQALGPDVVLGRQVLMGATVLISPWLIHRKSSIWERPERFRLANVSWETGLDYSMSHRFTIDYPADYDFIAAVFDALYSPERPVFGLRDIVSLLEARPDIFAINQRYAGVNWYRNHLADLQTIKPEETRCPTT